MILIKGCAAGFFRRVSKNFIFRKKVFISPLKSKNKTDFKSCSSFCNSPRFTIPTDKKQITIFEAGGGVRWYRLGQSVSQSRLSFLRNNEKRWTPYVSRIWQLVAVFFFQIKFSVRIPYWSLNRSGTPKGCSTSCHDSCHDSRVYAHRV